MAAALGPLLLQVPLHLDRALPSGAAQILLPGLHSPPGKQGHNYLFRIDILQELGIVYVRFGCVI